ncbi:MAG TPA: hypothetical protein VL326_20045 [Kofleriaceae bacterium]|jgi:hypothetical protein|nr:hypothetical protein [Kofleriaceae bacterium]
MLAKAKFAGNSLMVPDKWQQPSGDPDGDHYGKAFKPEEKVTAPAVAVPPLFTAHSMNKYHTDVQKMLTSKIGGYINGICSAIASAWSQWQTASTLVGVVINGPVAMGGQIVGPPLGPLILASAPKASPMEMKYSNAIANTLGTAWLSFTATVKVMGMPWYPAFAAVPSPVAPPAPNVPCPFAALMQVPVSISASVTKGQMIGMLGDPQAMYHKEIFDAVADAFEKTYNLWKVSTMVTNVLGTGPVPTFAPPYVPVGPVMGGVGNMTPGGFA